MKQIKIPKFLNQGRNILLFLLTTLIFIIFFTFVYTPSELPESGNFLGLRNKYQYILVLCGLGYLWFVVSRLLLFAALKKKRLSFLWCCIWMVVEILSITAIVSFTAWRLFDGLYEYPQVLVTRVLIISTCIILLPSIIFSIIFVIQELEGEVERLKAINGELMKGATQSPMCFTDHNGKVAFSTPRENVLYLRSNGNYVDIHYLNDNKHEKISLHNTLKALEEMFEGSNMIRCHRFFLVNLNRVKLLKREKNELLIEMESTEEPIPVSKTYSEAVASAFSK